LEKVKGPGRNDQKKGGDKGLAFQINQKWKKKGCATPRLQKGIWDLRTGRGERREAWGGGWGE